MKITFKKLSIPTPEIVSTLNKWGNDPALIPVIRPNFSKEAFERRDEITEEALLKRLKYTQIYLVYLDEKLVGEISFQVTPKQLYLRISGSAWIGINIGEASARGKGVGVKAMQYLEDEIRAKGIKRIELGVFEYNAPAIRLYKKMGYEEIGRIPEFTYWDGKMWTDIRMEKWLD
ncbi:MAG: GNAT family N-acetyltransferase [Anaerolineae bacterium]|jgi:RimJ/RimL family protein N-acetyltransferase|nr:GNAT family N-acetyltransferase [Anaerolineae bacterium]